MYVCVCVFVCVMTGKHVLDEVPYIPGTLCYKVPKICPTTFPICCATKNNPLFEIGTGCLIRSRINTSEYHISYFFRNFFKISVIYAPTIGTGNCPRHI